MNEYDKNVYMYEYFITKISYNRSFGQKTKGNFSIKSQRLFEINSIKIYSNFPSYSSELSHNDNFEYIQEIVHNVDEYRENYFHKLKHKKIYNLISNFSKYRIKFLIYNLSAIIGCFGLIINSPSLYRFFDHDSLFESKASDLRKGHQKTMEENV